MLRKNTSPGLQLEAAYSGATASDSHRLPFVFPDLYHRGESVGVNRGITFLQVLNGERS